MVSIANTRSEPVSGPLVTVLGRLRNASTYKASPTALADLGRRQRRAVHDGEAVSAVGGSASQPQLDYYLIFPKDRGR
jgi:hypothetical protein